MQKKKKMSSICLTEDFYTDPTRESITWEKYLVLDQLLLTDVTSRKTHIKVTLSEFFNYFTFILRLTEIIFLN